MIHFITPLYRYNYVPIIYSTIKNQVTDFNWHLIEGSKKTGDYDLTDILLDERIIYHKIKTNYAWGHEQRNYFITDIMANDNDWCYFLDDDNIVTHDLILTFNEEKNTDTDLVLFSQKKGLTEQIRLYGEDYRLQLGHADIGSFMIRWRIMKNTIIPYIDHRNADGHYADQLRAMKDKKGYNYKYIIDRYTRYNALGLEIT